LGGNGSTQVGWKDLMPFPSLNLTKTKSIFKMRPQMAHILKIFSQRAVSSRSMVVNIKERLPKV